MKLFIILIFLACGNLHAQFDWRGAFFPGVLGSQLPPDAPTGLIIPGHNQTADNRMPLTWASAARATSYNLYRSTTSGSGFSLIVSGISAPPYTNTTVTSCGGYFYKVTAVNSGGESGFSNQTNGTNIAASSTLSASVNYAPTVSTPGSPSAMVDLTCSGGYDAEHTIDYEIYAKVGGYWSAVAAGTSAYNDGTSGNYNVNLAWSAVASATEYRTYRQVDSGGFNDYYYSASNSVTDDGGPSAIAGSSPPTPVGDGSAQSVTLTWASPPFCNTITSIRRSLDSGGPYDEIATTAAALTTVTDYPTPGSTYYYVIVFNTAVHQSEFSNEQSAAF